jgi:hypothetical protein
MTDAGGDGCIIRVTIERVKYDHHPDPHDAETVVSGAQYA